MSTRGPDERSERAWVREGPLFAWFLGALIATTLLAGVLVAQHHLAAPVIATPSGHIAAGVVMYVLFVVLITRHVTRIAGRTVSVLTLLCLLSPVTIFWIHVPPAFALAIGIVPMVPLTPVYMRIHRSGHKGIIVVGVVTLALAHVVFASGVFLGVFDPTAMSGDALGRRRMALMHAWLGFPTAALLLWHGLASYYGRSFRSDAPLWRTLRIVVTTLAVLGAYAWWASRDVRAQAARNPDRLGLPGADRTVSVGNLKPGAGPNPVDFTRLVDPEVCGTCHGEIFREWQISPHRFAATNRPYARAVALMAEEEGSEKTIFCARCHNPLAALLGLTEGSSSPLFDSVSRVGISCQYCHIITHTDPGEATGRVQVTFEKRYRPEFSLGAWAPGQVDDALFVSDGLVAHSEDYKHGVYVESEFCAGCHRIVTPAEMNGGAELEQEDLYTPRHGSTAAKDAVSCTSCHMQLNVFEDTIHARPDHRTFGTLRSMSLLAPSWFTPAGGLEAFDRAAERWALGKLSVSSYEQVYLASIQSGKSRAHRNFLHERKPLAVTLEVPRSVSSGSELHVAVHTANGTHAHPLPSGPLDMNQLWLEGRVTDGSGATVFATGVLDADGSLPPGTHQLGGTPVDASGNPITEHRIWKTAAVRDERLLPPDGSIVDELVVPLSASVRGPLTVTVRCRYRRIEPELATWMLAPDHTQLPVHTLDEASVTVAVE